jgi:hypothetical protein
LNHISITLTTAKSSNISTCTSLVLSSTLPIMSDSSLVWAAYATGIAVLSGIASVGSNQRFAIAPQNTFSIPVVPYVMK